MRYLEARCQQFRRVNRWNHPSIRVRDEVRALTPSIVSTSTLRHAADAQTTPADVRNSSGCRYALRAVPGFLAYGSPIRPTLTFIKSSADTGWNVPIKAQFPLVFGLSSSEGGG